ncbi:MAG: addiction module component, family protein [Acidobacteria bacterium]|nr:MAG: addiction module component, family protein [Acidobacteriota bacterium]
MSDRARTLLREALTLSPEERADVAAELLASLDDSDAEDPAAVQAAWAAEIERRAQRVLSGESTGEPWEDVRNRIVQGLTNQ